MIQLLHAEKKLRSLNHFVNDSIISKWGKDSLDTTMDKEQFEEDPDIPEGLDIKARKKSLYNRFSDTKKLQLKS